MSQPGNKPPPILDQIQSQQPAAAHYFRLIQLGGWSYVIPPPGNKPLPLRPQPMRPSGVPDGTFEIEYYDADMELLEPADPNRPATLVVQRAGSALAAAPSNSEALDPGIASASKKPPAVSAATPQAVVESAAPAAAALPDPEGAQSSEDWNKSILHRQHVELRELLMEDFTHLVKIRSKLREEMKTWGDERNEVQHKLLQQSQRLVDIHAEIVEQREQDAARRKQEIEHLIDGRPKADYTQLGLGLLSTVEGVVTAIAGRGKKKKAGAKAQQILAALLRYANPADLQDLLNNPQAAEAFAQRMAEITGKKLPPHVSPPSGATATAAAASSGPKQEERAPQAATQAATTAAQAATSAGSKHAENAPQAVLAAPGASPPGEAQDRISASPADTAAAAKPPEARTAP